MPATASTVTTAPKRRGRPPSLGIAESGETALTLDRGLRILSVLADGPEVGVSLPALADEIDVDRRVVYRLAATLARHDLISRTQNGNFRLASGILRLARTVNPRLQVDAIPELERLADELGITAFITVRDGNYGLTLASVEPRRASFVAGYRVGTRHALIGCSAGRAILAIAPPSAKDPTAVQEVRERGYAIGYGKEHHGATGVAAPILAPALIPEASIGVISFGELDEAAIGERLMRSAAAIAALVS